jgi:hypothetical protein
VKKDKKLMGKAIRGIHLSSIYHNMDLAVDQAVIEKQKKFKFQVGTL